ncbi:natural resistance-associated macrophage protein-domain-containing protein [Boletus reticuloceps]|uniref:Natural resistance-associated macrophage protein-domain-containing protein n=1 Tax=Boletus reticuloceps TaxID=495285 RepID=A0A8I2YNV3_9AGAM|nr:natural resistance-associated macrophage protein-domain-containing protein [Boletus reticuloceps]
MSQAVTTGDEVNENTRRTGWPGKLAHYGWKLYHHTTKHVGVGIVCSVAYFDPGNWGVDLQAGSQYGYALLFTVLLSGIFATFLQVLASRLGIVTGLDFSSHCRLLFYDRPRHKLLWRWGVFYPLYVLAEIVLICTDLAELLGAAIALVLLFPALPLWSTVLLTAADVMLLLTIKNPLKNKPVRQFECIIGALVLAVLICMAIILSKVYVNWGDCFRGFVPSKGLLSSGSLYTSVGIVGATVMPHSLFLGSRLATQDRLSNDSGTDLPKFSEPSSSHDMTLSQRVLRSIRSAFSWKRLFSLSAMDEPSYPPNVQTHADRENNGLSFVNSHLYHGIADVITSLMGVAVIINSLLLIISSAVFYYNSGGYGNQSPATLFDAYAFIRNRLGSSAGILFAIGLLAAGESASIVATAAAQCVSEGFLRWNMSPTLRRLITRMIGLAPSLVVASVVGESGINTLLVASQVVISIVLPFFMFPLVYLTSSSQVMSVKSRKSVSPTQNPVPNTLSPGAPASKENAADSEDEVEIVDFSNGRVVTVLGYLMCTIILAADVYVLVTL